MEHSPQIKNPGNNLKCLQKNKEKVNNWGTAGNVAERAAVDGDYLAPNWQLMSEQTQQKHEGLIKDFTSQAGKLRSESRIHYFGILKPRF